MLIAICGKTNVGKSTLFKAFTLAEVKIASYPFTTIKPNRGIGYVKVNCPCKEFNIKCNPQNSFCLDGWRFAPVELIDVAGLVPGAHAGRGMGNQFLDDLRQADVLIQVVDISGTTDEEGNVCSPDRYDPLEEIKFLKDEIDIWFSGIIKRHLNQVLKQAKHSKFDMINKLAEIFSGLKITKGHIIEARKKADIEDVENFAKELRRVSKPIVIAANKIDMPSSEKNIERAKRKFPDLKIIPCCAEAELALREAHRKEIVYYIPGDNDFKVLKQDIDEKRKKALNFIKERILKKWGSTGVQEVLNITVFDALKCITAFPVEDENKLSNKDGQVLPDVHVLPEKSAARDLAESVHTDLAEKFVRAINCRTKRIVGKDYILENKDIIKIII